MNVLYTTEGCPKCLMARMMLREMKIPFEECLDINKAQALDIKQAPTLVMEDGARKDIKSIIEMHRQFRKERNDK